MLANDWKLPFSELIDWSEAAVVSDERLLLQLPEILKSINPMRTFFMRQKTQDLWERYFRSVEVIINTTLQVRGNRCLFLWYKTDASLLFRLCITGSSTSPLPPG